MEHSRQEMTVVCKKVKAYEVCFHVELTELAHGLDVRNDGRQWVNGGCIYWEKKNTGQEAGVEEEMKNWLDLSPEVLERGQGWRYKIL